MERRCGDVINPDSSCSSSNNDDYDDDDDDDDLLVLLENLPPLMSSSLADAEIVAISAPLRGGSPRLLEPGQKLRG